MRGETGPVLSLRTVARRCGVSHQAVAKAIRELRMPPLEDIPDLDEAERLWREQACPVKALVAEQERTPGPPMPANGALAKVKLRRERALAEIAEMEAGKMRGELVSRARIEAGLAVIDLALKDRLMTVPMAAMPEALDAAREGGLPAAVDVLARHIHAALSDIASAEVVSRAAGGR